MEMAISDKQVVDHLMEEELARRHAAFHIHLGVLTNTPGMTTWYGANLDEATTIHDLNGQPLFYDFPVLSPQREQIGLVRTAASRVLGVPVVDIYLGGPHWTPGRATLQARDYVEKELKGKVIDSKIVCYAYPRIGVEVNWKKPTGKIKRRSIFDLFDLTEVQEKPEPDVQGPGPFSIYDNLSEEMVPETFKRFAVYEKIFKAFQDKTDLDLSKPLRMEEYQRAQAFIMGIIKLFYSKTLQGFPLYPQETNDYCTKATCQMLLDWWNYSYDQSDIAAAMVPNPACPPLDDYCLEVNGLMNLTNGQLHSESDFTPSFNEVLSEINANRPFDYSFFGHSTACYGYRKLRISLYQTGGILNGDVYLHDPYPANQGAKRLKPYDEPWLWEVTENLSWYLPLHAFVYLTNVIPPS